jgi:hypothetical protein
MRDFYCGELARRAEKFAGSRKSSENDFREKTSSTDVNR